MLPEKYNKLFVFVGPAKKIIKDILEKIESDAFNTITVDEDTQLKKTYGDDYKNTFGNELVIPNRTFFIYTYICICVPSKNAVHDPPVHI